MSTPGFHAELSLARTANTYVAWSPGFAPHAGATVTTGTASPAGAKASGSVVPAISCAGVTCAAGNYCCSGCNWGSYKDDGCIGPGRRRWSSVLWNIPWGQSWEKTCACTPGQPSGVPSPRVPDRCVNMVFNIWGQWDVPDGLCCPRGQAFCNNVCVDLQTDPHNCGSCGNNCASGACCNGLCTNVLTDNANCGSCGNACKWPRYCANGVCVCPSNMPDCGGKCCGPPAACCGGLCMNLYADAFNCGACGHVCPGGQTCQAGVCACPPDKPTTCAGVCTNLSSDASHCGMCNSACLGGRICQNGLCTCPPGYTDCSGTCRNLSTDPQACGACGRACPAGQLCCSGVCKDVTSDAMNCGSCGNTCSQSCAGTRSCRNGSCAPLYQFAFLVENAVSKCAVTVVPETATSQSEAKTCVEKLYPAPWYLVGTGSNYTYGVKCPNYSCRTVSNVLALSAADGRDCVQYYNQGCAVVQGGCTA